MTWPSTPQLKHQFNLSQGINDCMTSSRWYTKVQCTHITYIYTHIHTHIHTCIHIHTHTYIHAYTCTPLTREADYPQTVLPATDELVFTGTPHEAINWTRKLQASSMPTQWWGEWGVTGQQPTMHMFQCTSIVK